MEEKIIVALDAMGGDNGAAAMVEGAVNAALECAPELATCGVGIEPQKY